MLTQITQKTEIQKQGISHQDIRVIPNGILGEFLNRHGNDAAKDGKVIVCFGVFYPIKGQDLLIRAFKAANCSKDHLLVFVGGPDGLFKSICRSLAIQLGLEKKILFLDHMSHEHLIPLLLECEFCVFPSRLETFNIAVFEAMALGKAVIATNKGGPVEYIRNQWDGILVNPENISELATAIDFLVSNFSVRTNIGKRARVRAQEFKWDHIAKRYLSLYQRLCKE